MRADIDPKKLEKFNVLCWNRFEHPNAFGGLVEEGDYDGYKHTEPNGSITLYLVTRRGDPSYDWLDVTRYADHLNFMTLPKTS